MYRESNEDHARRHGILRKQQHILKNACVDEVMRGYINTQQRLRLTVPLDWVSSTFQTTPKH